MRIFPVAQFEADVLDDGVQNFEGDVLIDAGQGVAETIAGMLKRLGYHVEAPELRELYGWTFEVDAGGRRVWFQVTQFPGDTYDVPAEVTLITKEKPTLFQMLFRRKDTTYSELLSGLDWALHAEPRFTNIRWGVDSDLRGPVAAGPLNP